MQKNYLTISEMAQALFDNQLAVTKQRGYELISKQKIRGKLIEKKTKIVIEGETHIITYYLTPATYLK